MAAKIKIAPLTNATDRVSVPTRTEITPVTTEEKGITTATKEGSNFFRQVVRISQHSTVEISTTATKLPKCWGAKEKFRSSTNRNE